MPTPADATVEWAATTAHRAWRALLAVRARLFQELDVRPEVAGSLSVSDLELLCELAENGGRERMSALAGQIMASKSGLTRRVDRLMGHGLVTREAVPEDRRGTYAVLTEAGWQAVRDTMPATLNDIRHYFFAVLSEDELAYLADLLERVAEAPTWNISPQRGDRSSS